MYTEEYDKRPFPFRDFLLKFIIIVIFALLLVWLIPKFISPKTSSNEATSSKVFEKNLTTMKKASINYYSKKENLPTDNSKEVITLRQMISKNMLRAINETECMFITYNNIFIKPYIHNTNNGNTDVLPNVEYLVKVPSLWDLTSSMYLNITRYTVEKVAQLLNLDKDDLFGIKILELTEGGCINKVKVGYTIFDGEEFRQNLNLPSKDMTILIDDKYITFINRGHGDNLGLSLNGSAELAKAGCNYLQILNYYFPTCKIKKYI